jgi:hypothetical protein
MFRGFVGRQAPWRRGLPRQRHSSTLGNPMRGNCIEQTQYIFLLFTFVKDKIKCLREAVGIEQFENGFAARNNA